MLYKAHYYPEHNSDHVRFYNTLPKHKTPYICSTLVYFPSNINRKTYNIKEICFVST